MKQHPTLFARDLAELNSVMALMPRQNGCVVCNQNVQLVCPTACTNGQVCGFKVLLDCTSCPQAACVPSSQPAVVSPPAGPNVGAIAGGVAGGLVAAALATYLVWRWCVKSKRRQTAPDTVLDTSESIAAEEKHNGLPGWHRDSTHTVHSIASTVYTRASNVIQIAYIPGVTNRAMPSPFQTSLAPPVPPLPLSVRDSGALSQYGEQHFFTPHDLRDSTFSDMTPRTSYARTSYAPRSSIASTVYGKNATVPAPAQQGVFSRPTVVSVKTPSSNSSQTPLVPPIDYEKHGRPVSGNSSFSVGHTFLNHASTASHARAQVVKLKSSLSSVQTAVAKPESTDDGTSQAAESPDPRPFVDSPHTPSGSFADPVDRPRSLSDVIDNQPRRSHAHQASSARGESPFGDEHATSKE